ncbi:hypothetical protein DdX_21937 [Ditylenchus destructor]|uniref:HAT C-terminal dimerisation domain-containing protein n=1 Tax=Ditylenchus destructor TaxID=166010 RepID=A0AAD4MF26_9BILA|nr:hypothetical protein DdX_21937 [Ditylenchus destructor]
MPDVDETIFDEVSTLNTVIEQIPDEEFQKLSTEEKWKKIFKSDLPSLYQLVSKILSVPVSNAFVERIFSLVSAQWTDTRNSLKEETVKGLVQVKVNFDLSCQEMHKFLLSNMKLLDQISYGEKYDI